MRPILFSKPCTASLSEPSSAYGTAAPHQAPQGGTSVSVGAQGPVGSSPEAALSGRASAPESGSSERPAQMPSPASSAATATIATAM